MPAAQERTARAVWRALPYEEWQDTRATLHLWMQIVGKVKLKLSPFLNQWWEVALEVTPRGMTTGRIPYQDKAFAVDFDFLAHTLALTTNKGQEQHLLLRPCSVAQFYQEFLSALAALDIHVTITPVPSEVAHPIPFAEDTQHASYDSGYVTQWWQIQLRSSLILDRFRTNFRGKSSPVQFFWGSFDLNTTRFSGKRLPDRTDWPKGYSFMRYAENEENFTCGFWPGDERFPHAAFYSYLYPAPAGCETIDTGPASSYFHTELRECILPYAEVRRAQDPEGEILDFLETTYRQYAGLAGWDLESLTGLVPVLA
ncbi:MAG: DUF5996 family protein [Planctomycetes bacterium]|nr:DUF5996 family protein [Planctomycetota bacterium]